MDDQKIRRQPQTPNPAAGPRPENKSLYGGISGLSLAVPEFELSPGFMIRDTYAHVMAPYVMAFQRPEKSGEHHPGPWKSASGGTAFDVTIELALVANSTPTTFDRLNHLWWVLALLRLITGAALRLPVVSDIPFAAVPTNSREPNLFTIETPPRQFRVTRSQPDEITLDHLRWVKNTFVVAAPLMDSSDFNRAFSTLDSAIWSHSPASAILMVWSSLEALFRPGQHQITKTLAASIATYLNPAGPDRDRAYHNVSILYEARGAAIHDAQTWGGCVTK